MSDCADSLVFCWTAVKALPARGSPNRSAESTRGDGECDTTCNSGSSVFRMASVFHDCHDSFMWAIGQQAGDGTSAAAFRPPKMFHLDPPQFCQQEAIALSIKNCMYKRPDPPCGKDATYLYNALRHLIAFCESSGDVDGVCDELYERLAELVTLQSSLSGLQAQGAPLWVSYPVNQCFPSSPPVDGFAKISMRRSAMFSDISQRVWPATFALVDSLAVLGSCISDLLGSTGRGVDFVELGSGPGLAGLALATMWNSPGSPLSDVVRSLTLTDGDPAGMDLLASNVKLNFETEEEPDASKPAETSASVSKSSFPVRARRWEWGAKEREGEQAAAVSPPVTCRHSILFGSDLIYDPTAVRQLVATLRQQLLPRPCEGTAAETPPDATWKAVVAKLVAADTAAVGGEHFSSWPSFPWEKPAESGCNPPLFALIASTIRNEDTYAGFLGLLQQGSLRYYDITEEVDSLLHAKALEAGVPAHMVATSLACPHKHSSALPPSLQFSAIKRFASVWEAFLVPDEPSSSVGTEPSASEPPLPLPHAGAAAAMPVKLLVILPPLRAPGQLGSDDETGSAEGLFGASS